MPRAPLTRASMRGSCSRSGTIAQGDNLLDPSSLLDQGATGRETESMLDPAAICKAHCMGEVISSSGQTQSSRTSYLLHPIECPCRCSRNQGYPTMAGRNGVADRLCRETLLWASVHGTPDGQSVQLQGLIPKRCIYLVHVSAHIVLDIVWRIPHAAVYHSIERALIEGDIYRAVRNFLHMPDVCPLPFYPCIRSRCLGHEFDDDR